MRSTHTLIPLRGLAVAKLWLPPTQYRGTSVGAEAATAHTQNLLCGTQSTLQFRYQVCGIKTAASIAFKYRGRRDEVRVTAAATAAPPQDLLCGTEPPTSLPVRGLR